MQKLGRGGGDRGGVRVCVLGGSKTVTRVNLNAFDNHAVIL